MNTFEIALGIFLVVLTMGNGILIWILLRRRNEPEKNSALEILQRDMHELSRVLDERLHDSARMMSDTVHRQFTESQKLVQHTNETLIRHLTDVAQGVTEVKEAGKQVFTIADQLQNLEKVLTHQKQRGALGEEGLKIVLENVLPVTAFKLQYAFENGEVVDAAVMTKEGIIPVDAKFSLDNYNRLCAEDNADKRAELERDFKNDLKKRIDETAKYIRPREGTLPFALMFIPAEGIYYDLLVNQIGTLKVNTRSLIDYAYRDKHVIIVSPTTFTAYLQSVLYGFRAFKIEESAKEIRKNVEGLTRHLHSYDEYFKKVGTSLGTTVNHFNAAQKELGKIDKDVYRITGEAIEIEQIALDGPEKGGE